MRTLLCLLIWLGCLTSGPAWAEEGPSPWRVCAGDLAILPYLSGNDSNAGLTDRLLIEAGRKSGLEVRLLHLPYKRCRVMFDAGEVDALIVASTPINVQQLQFPLKAGWVDSSRRLARLNLVWVRRSDTQLDWDGAHFSGDWQWPVIGARNTLLLAISALRGQGYKVDDEAKSTRQVLSKLAAHRVDVAVGLQDEVDRALREPDLSQLVVLPKGFASGEYYAVVHRHLPPMAQEHVERWWAAIGRLRDTAEFSPH